MPRRVRDKRPLSDTTAGLHVEDSSGWKPGDDPQMGGPAERLAEVAFRSFAAICMIGVAIVIAAITIKYQPASVETGLIWGFGVAILISIWIRD
jgi:hypothetical protein